MVQGLRIDRLSKALAASSFTNFSAFQFHVNLRCRRVARSEIRVTVVAAWPPSTGAIGSCRVRMAVKKLSR